MLRGWSHGKTEQLFVGGPAAGGATGTGARECPRVAVGGDQLTDGDVQQYVRHLIEAGPDFVDTQVKGSWSSGRAAAPRQPNKVEQGSR